MSRGPSVSARFCVKFDVGDLHEKSVKKSKSGRNWMKISVALHEHFCEFRGCRATFDRNKGAVLGSWGGRGGKTKYRSPPKYDIVHELLIFFVILRACIIRV
jgi:hypothetical protein